MTFTMVPPTQLSEPPGSPYRSDAPPDRAIFTVLATSPANEDAPAILHDYIGESFEREVSETGRTEVGALLACGQVPGTYVWEGAVIYSRCGPYDCPDYEMDLSGTTRPATFEEAQAVARDEYPWNRALWLTGEAIAEEQTLAERGRLIARAEGELEDAAIAWIKHMARVPSSNVAAAVFMAAKKLYRATEDPV